MGPDAAVSADRWSPAVVTGHNDLTLADQRRLTQSCVKRSGPAGTAAGARAAGGAGHCAPPDRFQTAGKKVGNVSIESGDGDHHGASEAGDRDGAGGRSRRGLAGVNTGWTAADAPVASCMWLPGMAPADIATGWGSMDTIRSDCTSQKPVTVASRHRPTTIPATGRRRGLLDTAVNVPILQPYQRYRLGSGKSADDAASGGAGGVAERLKPTLGQVSCCGAAAVHLSSMRPKCHTTRASAQVAANRPTMLKPSLLKLTFWIQSQNSPRKASC